MLKIQGFVHQAIPGNNRLWERPDSSQDSSKDLIFDVRIGCKDKNKNHNHS